VCSDALIAEADVDPDDQPNYLEAGIEAPARTGASPSICVSSGADGSALSPLTVGLTMAKTAISSGPARRGQPAKAADLRPRNC
jgi:hypothetical protein